MESKEKEQDDLIYDNSLTDDLDLLCAYVSVRFIKNCPSVANNNSEEFVKYAVNKFMIDIREEMVAFINTVNFMASNEVLIDDLEKV